MPEEIRLRYDDLDLFPHPVQLIQVKSPFAGGGRVQASTVISDDEVVRWSDESFYAADLS